MEVIVNEGGNCFKDFELIDFVSDWLPVMKDFVEWLLSFNCLGIPFVGIS